MLKNLERHRPTGLRSLPTTTGRTTATRALFSGRWCRAALVFGCLTVLMQASAQAEWRQHITGTGSSSRDIVNSIALAPSGDAVAAGAIDNGGTGIDLAVVKLGGATGEVLWQREIPGVGDQEEAGLDVVVDAAGDAYVAGELDLYFSVVKFSGADGSEIWRAEIDGSNTTFRIPQLAQSLALDASGNVIAAGHVNNAGTARDFAVVKLDAATGAELWRLTLDGGDGSPDIAYDVAVDASNDVIAAGKLELLGSDDDFTVVKIDGATGVEIWRYRYDGTESFDDVAFAVAINSAGDIAAGGVIDNTATREDFAVVKLAGATGDELWRREIDGGGGGKVSYEQANVIAFDSADDVVAVGELENIAAAQDLATVKLSGADGSILWRTEINGRDESVAYDVGLALGIDSNDDVFAGGRLENGPKMAFDYTVVKLDSATGAEIWRTEADGNSRRASPGQEEVRALVVDGADNIIAGGFLDDRDTDEDFTVTKLDGETGVVGPLRGGQIVMTDYDGKPQRRKLKVGGFDKTLTMPAAGGPYDPRVVGAQVTIMNPDTLETAVISLPAGPGWRTIDDPSGPLGYSYGDNRGDSGPCRGFELRRQGRMRLACSGKTAPLPFSLDEPAQGVMVVSVSFGGFPSQCIKFGGTVTRDQPAESGGKGIFKARRAPPVTGEACP